MDKTTLQNLLCRTLCVNTAVLNEIGDQWQVATPFHFPDGDSYTLYLKELASGGFRLSDAGSTMMHLSYENDLAKFRNGTRERLLQQVIADGDITEDDGEFFLDSAPEDLGRNIFRFGQTLTRIHDLSFLNRLRVESTFYEDLKETLLGIVDSSKIHEAYEVPGVPRASEYPVDFYIESSKSPLYIFGVPSKDKARLATIVLQHLIAAQRDFSSMIVFQNMSDIPRTDLSRLTNAANDQVDSLDAYEDLQRKIRRSVG
jgi:hypothetical protein